MNWLQDAISEWRRADDAARKAGEFRSQALAAAQREREKTMTDRSLSELNNVVTRILHRLDTSSRLEDTALRAISDRLDHHSNRIAEISAELSEFRKATVERMSAQTRARATLETSFNDHMIATNNRIIESNRNVLLLGRQINMLLDAVSELSKRSTGAVQSNDPVEPQPAPEQEEAYHRGELNHPFDPTPAELDEACRRANLFESRDEVRHRLRMENEKRFLEGGAMALAEESAKAQGVPLTINRIERGRSIADQLGAIAGVADGNALAQADARSHDPGSPRFADAAAANVKQSTTVILPERNDLRRQLGFELPRADSTRKLPSGANALLREVFTESGCEWELIGIVPESEPVTHTSMQAAIRRWFGRG